MSDDMCKHNSKHLNECYGCFLDAFYKRTTEEKEKTALDELHETISELKVRISKLEQYKRLQDDANKEIIRHFERLDEHRKKQIDENRAVSKHLDQLDQDNAQLNASQNDLETDIQMLQGWRVSLDNDCGSAHEKIINLEEINKEQVSFNSYVSEQLFEMNNRLRSLDVIERHDDGSITFKMFHNSKIDGY